MKIMKSEKMFNEHEKYNEMKDYRLFYIFFVFKKKNVKQKVCDSINIFAISFLLFINRHISLHVNRNTVSFFSHFVSFRFALSLNSY